MKHKTLFGVLCSFMLLWTCVLFMGCPNGTKDDDSSNTTGGNGTSDGTTKPSELATSASYDDTIKKLDDIIAYCDKHSGNDSNKSNAESLKTTYASYQSSWSSVGPSYITAVNALIKNLTDDGDNGDSGRGNKPAQLPSTASYNAAISKLDEIIAYCTNHPGNDEPKADAEDMKTTYASYQSSWSSMGSHYIAGVNALIKELI